MRADRLLSLLMLLQTRGRLTAHDLADELEVSERTIYRDLLALSAAGIPVYAERGPGGGVQLVEEYRTTLTGLSPEEARALFMVSNPAPLAQLGLGEKFKAAQLKLAAALPDTRRPDEARVRERILLDSTWWFQSEQHVPCLLTLQHALWQDRRVYLKVRWDFFDTEFEQEAEPLGLVAKANIWYLVYGRGGSLHVVRVSQIIQADVLPDSFTRPADFDLADFWERWCRDYESEPPFEARVRVAPGALRSLADYVGDRARDHIPPAPAPESDGWVTLDLPFESFNAARTRLLGLGRAVEVLAPETLRKSLIDFAEQILGFYRKK
jgi:predicted DNA-binding transcriptional regulator YafY